MIIGLPLCRPAIHNFPGQPGAKVLVFSDPQGNEVHIGPFASDIARKLGAALVDPEREFLPERDLIQVASTLDLAKL